MSRNNIVTFLGSIYVQVGGVGDGFNMFNAMENNAQFTMRKVFDSHGDGRVVKIGYMFLHIISMWADEYSFRIVLFTNPNT